jgi:HTH-type transcriptional regulator/antitoxin HigA
MELKPLKSEEEYEEMLDWIDTQFDLMPDPDSREGGALQVGLLIIKAYEDVHHSVGDPDPIEAIKLKMEEKGLKSKDLVEWIGSKSYVSALLNRKKPLTLKLVRIFHERLGIPAQVLLR